MRRVLPERPARRLAERTGAALAIVLILIGLFGVFCQALTILAAVQHRQTFQQADQAQSRRLASSGLLRAKAALERDPEWRGELWTPALRPGESAIIQLSVRRNAGPIHLRADATFTTTAGRIHKSSQTLDVPRASDEEATQGTTP